jgi:hypothetical protein
MRNLTLGTVLLGLVMLVGAERAMAAMLIDSFDAGAQQRWRFFADTVMGGKSEGKVTFEREGDVSFARLTGTVSTENNGGFIQFRTELRSPPPADAKGIALVVRGNGSGYFVHVRTKGMLLPWQYYQAPFSTTGAWREVRIPFTAFKRSDESLRVTPATDSIRSVGIVAYGRDYEAKVDVREIGFY